MELDPIQTQFKNGKCSVYNRTTAFPLVASAMQIDELWATQQILLPQGLNATECIQPPKHREVVSKTKENNYIAASRTKVSSTSIGSIMEFSE